MSTGSLASCTPGKISLVVISRRCGAASPCANPDTVEDSFIVTGLEPVALSAAISVRL